ncbi:hypothetical protein B9J90_13475 [Vibrio sp. V09_P4A23P171]|nr:hypothetical protein B9J90_13475 [Vibrio sp. V09_P4A23P171]
MIKNGRKSKGETQMTIFDELLPDKLGHGGKRPGSGRKKKESSKLVRVPESLVDEFTTLKDLYHRLDELDKNEIKDQLKHLITFAEVNQPS